MLLRRSLEERRHETFNKLRIFQINLISFSVFWGFFPLNSAVYTIPERPMLLKERASGMYRLSSYFMARTAGDLPMELALPTTFTIIIYWMGGHEPQPSTSLLYLFIVLYSFLVAQSLGLTLGALLMEVKQATALASAITLTFLMAGGYYVQHIPPFLDWLNYPSFSSHCFKLLLGIQFKPTVTYECIPGFIRCSAMEFPAIKSVGLDETWKNIGMMALMLVGYRLVAYCALQQLHRPS